MTLARKVAVGGMVAFLAMVVLVGGCSRHVDPFADVPGTGPKVVASFPPLYCFARNVAGDDAQVICLMTTTDPHAYHPDSKYSVKVKKADVLIINGLELDDRVLELRDSTGNDKLKVINLGELLEEKDHDLLLKSHEEGSTEHKDEHKKEGDKDEHKKDADKHDHGKHEGHHHDHGEHDPHVWLGIEQARAMVQLIADKLGQAAPDRKAAYEKNAAAYIKKLDELHGYGKKQLAGAKNKRIVSTHDSMRYFAKSFGLNIVGSIMPQPEIGASAKELADLVKLCTDKDAPVRVITIEPQYGEKAAETLMEQIKQALAKANRKDVAMPHLVTFDTLETTPETTFSPDFYLTTMRKNIDELAKALK